MADINDVLSLLRRATNKNNPISLTQEQMDFVGNMNPKQWSNINKRPGLSFSPGNLPDTSVFNPGKEWSLFSPEERTGLFEKQPIKNEFPLTPGFNTETSPASNVMPQEKAGLYDYWKKPIIGGMPRDQFVTLMGVLGNAIAPNSFGGRLGAGLAGMASIAEQRRLGYEERETERAERKERFETLRQEKRLDTLTQFILKSKSPELQLRLYKSYAESWNKGNLDFQLPTDIEFGDNTQEFFKQIAEVDKIGAELKWSREETNQAKRDIQLRMGLITNKEWGKESLKGETPELMRGAGGTMIPKEEGAEFYQKPEKPTEPRLPQEYYNKQTKQNELVTPEQYFQNPNLYAPAIAAAPALKTIPTEQVKGLKTFDDLAILAESLKGIGTKYAGPIKGRMKLYTSKFFADPEFIKAKTNLAKLMPVVYALSGKQINEWEMEWLKNDILPNLASPGENFEATLDQFIDWVKGKSSSLKEGYKQAGYNLPENKPDPLGIR